MPLDAAIETFVRGFTKTKSLAHPYVGEKVDGLWIMRDGPGRKLPRKIEVVANGLSPAEVVERIQNQGLPWHFVCHIHTLDEDFDAIRAAYKAIGYRAMSTEGFFVHDLQNVPQYQSEPPVRLIGTQAEANAIPQVAKHKIKIRDGIDQFGIWDDERDYGYVQSVPAGDTAWVGSLYVFQPHRRKGYGRALMSSVLQHQAERYQASVLLASSDGAKLYPSLGYQQIGVLQLFCPSTRS